MEGSNSGRVPPQGTNDIHPERDQDKSFTSQARDTSQKGREEEVVDQQDHDRTINNDGKDLHRSSESEQEGAKSIGRMEPQFSHMTDRGFDEDQNYITGRSSTGGEQAYKEGMGDNDSRDILDGRSRDDDKKGSGRS